MTIECCGKCSRRKFLISSTKAALGAAVSAELLGSCNKTPSEIIGDNEKKIAERDLDLYTELKEIGGSAKLYDIESYPLIAYRKSESEVVVVYSICTHQGYEVELPDENGEMECPHDGAKFDIEENGVSLSPELTTLSLKQYYAILNGNKLSIYER